MITSTAFPELPAVVSMDESRLRPRRQPRGSSTRNGSGKDGSAASRSLAPGVNDDGAPALDGPPMSGGLVSSVILLGRWAAVGAGLTVAGRHGLDGEVKVLVTLAECVALTSWRTIRPLRVGSPSASDRRFALLDVVALGLAVGVTGGSASAFVGCVIVAVSVVAFGWGLALGAGAAGAAGITMSIGQLVAGEPLEPFRASTFLVVATVVLAVPALSWLRGVLVDSELERNRRSARGDALAETNELLTMLNAIARTLPTSLNQREALDNVRSQIVTTFKPHVICLLEHDEANQEWVPKIAEGCILKPTSHLEDLAAPLRAAIDGSIVDSTANGGDALLVERLSVDGTPTGIAPSSGSGMYTVLRVRSRVVGVLGVEHHGAERYNDRDRRLLAGLGDTLALTLDNARWFGRLRSLGTEEERVRIARDLHDRLGQWLTYISFELERMITSDVAPPQGAPLSVELTTLYADVQTALDELRETLRQLRSGISDGRWLSKVGREIVERFFDRTEIDAEFVAAHPDEHLSPAIENELLRILQEALNNVEKHSRATKVDVRWDVQDGIGQLSIHDNGAGFDQARGIRDSAYGLVGMRERTDVIGGRLQVSSAPGSGTTISVSTGIPADTQDRSAKER